MDGDVDVDDIILQSPTTEFGRVLVLSGVAALCKLTMLFMNRTTIKNEPALQIITDRPEDQALITVSNHTRAFFRSGKVLPIKRGEGLQQPNLEVIARQLGRHGDWLHVFPEGRISYDGRLSDLRWGVGKMVCDVMKHSGGIPPIVLPYYHAGMGAVMPYKARLPHFGHNVTITLGEPLDLSDLVCNCNSPACNQADVWRAITSRINGALLDLEMRTVANVDQTKTGAAPQRHVYPRKGEENGEGKF